MVKPILCYASQIWGYEYVDSIETVQNKYCKNILHVAKTTNTCMVLGDCGRLPLCTTYFINCIRYWCTLLTMPSHRYPKQCYNMLKSLGDVGRKCWVTNVKTLLYKYSFGFIWISQDVGNINSFIRIFRQRVIDCCTQDWHASVENSSRCYHYRHFKSLLNVEKYLSLDIYFKYRAAMSRFRLSNHKLNIELGRHSGILKENRICSYCLQNLNTLVIDCELHAFFKCHKYDDVRNSYLFNWYTHGTDPQDFYVLMSSHDADIVRKISLYVYHLMLLISHEH